MRVLLTLSSALIAALASFAPAQAVEVEVISGDTIRVGEHEWRIANIDAPRMDQGCSQERALGYAAQEKLAELLGQGEMEIAPTGERDQHQRPMARVRINGEDVGDAMVRIGLAQRHGYARPLCVRSGLADYQRWPSPMPMQPRRGRTP